MILIHTCAARTASTWVEAILKALQEDLDLAWWPRGPLAYLEALAGGLSDRHVYPAVFLPWEDLALERCRFPYRILHIRRDPRDLLVSKYFSVLYSHVEGARVLKTRAVLATLDIEEGMLHLVRKPDDKAIQILLSHLGKGPAEDCTTADFAELTRDPFSVFRRYLDACELRMTDYRLRELLGGRTFEHFTQGRPRGEEDRHHHFRKGVCGDWKHYFTPRIKDEFKRLHGQSLIALGYEKDLDW